MPQPSTFETEKATEKLKTYKSPGSNPIPAELIKAGGRKTYSDIYRLVNYMWKRKRTG